MSITDARARATTGSYWLRPGLDVQDDVLHIANRNTLDLAASEQLPVFVTDLASIGVQARKLHSAIANAGLETACSARNQGATRTGDTPLHS